jgi:hypothetical protein
MGECKTRVSHKKISSSSSCSRQIVNSELISAVLQNTGSQAHTGRTGDIS